MKLILSHRSALEYWRMPNRRKPSRQETSRMCVLGADVPGLDQIERHPLVSSGALTRPIEIMTGSRTASGDPNLVVHHVRKEPLPYGSLVKIDEDTFVVSPELCAVQRASARRLPACIGLGYELCGDYSLVNADPASSSTGSAPTCGRGFHQREPLTTIARLESYVARARGMHGVKQLKRSLRFLLPHSASPMETALAASFCVSRLAGGYMLGKPALNCQVAMERESGYDRLRPDIFWPTARLAVEYDSYEHHAGPLDISRDAKRRNQFVCKDVMVVTVTYAQLSNYLELDKVAHVLARRLGIRIPPRDEQFAKRQIELLSVLLHASSSLI